ncbi:MAG: polysaccharide biosynthesis tyrosine autokinase [Cocleimonas sp.]
MNDKNNLADTYQDGDKIDLLELLHIILQGKWLIIFFAVISTIFAFIYAYGQAPIYKADALLRVEGQKATIPSIDDLVGLSRNDNSIGTEVEILKSRKNLSETVEELNLEIIANPKRIRLFSNLYKRFFNEYDINKPPLLWEKFDNWVAKYAWGNELIKIDQLEIPEHLINEPLTLISRSEDTFDLLLEDQVILKGSVGQTATSADKTISVFVTKLKGLPGTEFSVIKISRRDAIRSLQWSIFAEEKGFEKSYTGIILLSLTGGDQEKILKILDKVSQTYVEQNKSRSSKEASNALKFLEEQIKPIKKDVDRAEANLKFYLIDNKTTNLPQETQLILNIIVDIDAELQKLSFTKKELSQKYTDQHPTIQALNAQEKELILRKEKTQGKISNLPKSQQKLFELERGIKVANSLYIDLLNKIQEFRIAKASTVGNAYILDVADIDTGFVRPKRRMILAIGMLLGTMLGVGIVLLKKLFDRNVTDPEKLEQATGISVYATIPVSKNVKLTGGFKGKNRKQKSLLAIDNKNDQAIEGLRSLRTSLHFALHEAKNNIVMITGPSPYIGKSFISSNFAAVTAASAKRVLLIDADMRKGYLHKLLDLDLSPGLSDVVTQKSTIDEVITTVNVGDASMDVITRGQTPPNPSEILMYDDFKIFLDKVSKNYDLVLIDSPPIHAVTDPAIIGSHAGVVFIVVHSDTHSMKEIKHAVARLSQTGIDTKGFIFNGYVANKYGYGYNSYYGEYK